MLYDVITHKLQCSHQLPFSPVQPQHPPARPELISLHKVSTSDLLASRVVVTREPRYKTRDTGPERVVVCVNLTYGIEDSRFVKIREAISKPLDTKQTYYDTIASMFASFGLRSFGGFATTGRLRTTFYLPSNPTLIPDPCPRGPNPSGRAARPDASGPLRSP